MSLVWFVAGLSLGVLAGVRLGLERCDRRTWSEGFALGLSEGSKRPDRHYALLLSRYFCFPEDFERERARRWRNGELPMATWRAPSDS